MKGVEVVMVVGLLIGLAAEVTMATSNSKEKEVDEAAALQVEHQKADEAESAETVVEDKDGVQQSEIVSQDELDELADLQNASGISQADGNELVKQRQLQAESKKRLGLRRKGRLFGLVSSTSVKRLVTTTIAAINTCLSVDGGTPCIGRKRRSFVNKLSVLDDIDDWSQHLAPSLSQDVETLVSPADGGSASDGRIARQVKDRNGRVIFTIWVTVSSTLTLTSTSYIAGTTITASALCAAPNVTAGCFGR